DALAGEQVTYDRLRPEHELRIERLVRSQPQRVAHGPRPDPLKALEIECGDERALDDLDHDRDPGVRRALRSDVYRLVLTRRHEAPGRALNIRSRDALTRLQRRDRANGVCVDTLVAANDDVVDHNPRRILKAGDILPRQ